MGKGTRSYLNLGEVPAENLKEFLSLIARHPNISESDKRRARPILRMLRDNIPSPGLRQIYVTESQREFLKEVVKVMGKEKDYLLE